MQSPDLRVILFSPYTLKEWKRNERGDSKSKVQEGTLNSGMTWSRKGGIEDESLGH